MNKLRQIFGARPDWGAKIAEYSSRLAGTQQKIDALKAERLEHVLPGAEGDRTARTELDRIAAEISIVEREQVELLGALEQARTCLSHQQERDAAERERKDRAECARLTGELLHLDGRADTALAQLRAALDAREAKLQELKPFIGTAVIRVITNHSHVARVVKRGLYPHVIVETVGRCDESLAELDSKLLRSRSGDIPILEEAAS